MATHDTTKVQPTVDELVALLKKTALPTVLCEGSDDLIIYRRFEALLSHCGVNVLPAGGRLNVLQIFERRSEIPSSVRIAFVADQDVWVYSSVPTAFVAPTLVFTTGYSIENDVIEDGKLDALLVGQEATKFQSELSRFLDWYALALARHLANTVCPISLHPSHVLDPHHLPTLLSLSPGESYPFALRATLSANYKRLLRGKSLLALLVQHINSRPGQPRHSSKALLEGVAARPGPLFTRLTEAIEAALTA